VTTAADTILDLIRSGRGAEAERELREAIAGAPDDVGLRRLAAALYRRANQYETALGHARRAVEIDPTVGAHHEAAGLSLMQLQRIEEAEAALRRAVELDPTLATAHNALGMAAMMDRRYGEAERCFTRAIEANPRETAALCNLATMLKNLGRGDEAAALMGPALQALSDDVGVQWTGAVMSNYAASMSPDEVAEQHRRFGAAVVKAIGWKPWRFRNSRDPDRALRVGFVSPDMRRHSVAFFLLPLIEALDRSQFAVACYSLTDKTDEITARFKAAAQGWRDASRLTNNALVRLIREDAIDVLIDCGGLFEGSRPAALAQRCAPVQLTYLGYPNTTGLEQVDGRIVDAITDPPGSEGLAVERLERIAGCFLCFSPLEDVPLPERDEGRDRAVTFGSFNVFSKLNDSLLDVWAELLRRVPGSRLLLKTRTLDSEEVRQWTRDEFACRGIDAQRLELVGYVESQAAHRAMYGRVDIALDPFPYHGTTTTCEALWMGVPVVTLSGPAHPGRVGASLLRAIGEWIAETTGQYIELAAALARDGVRRGAIHATLREEMAASILCDARDYALRYAAVIRSAWRRWCAAETP